MNREKVNAAEANFVVAVGAVEEIARQASELVQNVRKVMGTYKAEMARLDVGFVLSINVADSTYIQYLHGTSPGITRAMEALAAENVNAEGEGKDDDCGAA